MRLTSKSPDGTTFVLYVQILLKMKIVQRTDVPPISWFLLSHLVILFLWYVAHLSGLYSFFYLPRPLHWDRKSFNLLMCIFIFMFSISLQSLLRLTFWDEGNSQVNRNSKTEKSSLLILWTKKTEISLFFESQYSFACLCLPSMIRTYDMFILESK